LHEGLGHYYEDRPVQIPESERCESAEFHSSEARAAETLSALTTAISPAHLLKKYTSRIRFKENHTNPNVPPGRAEHWGTMEPVVISPIGVRFYFNSAYKQMK
jgi:hypothetical protein